MVLVVYCRSVCIVGVKNLYHSKCKTDLYQWMNASLISFVILGLRVVDLFQHPVTGVCVCEVPMDC